MKIAHTADWHLMRRHLGVSRRGNDFTRAAVSSVTQATEAGAVALIHGGDILDARRAESFDFQAFRTVHEAAQDCGLPVFAIEGNHDKSDPPWSSLVGFRLEDIPIRHGGLHSGRDDFFEIPDDIEGGVYDITGKVFRWRGLTFSGLGSTPARWAEDYIQGAPAQGIDVVVWHGAVQELIGFPSDEALQLAGLSLQGLSALMLGDIHICNYVVKDNCVVGYPGATEVIRFGDPLVTSITVFDTTTSPWKYEFIPIHTRKTFAFRINLEQELHDALAQVQECADQHPVVLGRYSRDLEGVVARFNSVLDPTKAVIRLKPMPPVELVKLASSEQADWRKPELTDGLPNFFPEQDGLAALALLLAQNNSVPDMELEAYIQRRRETVAQLIEK